MAPMATKRITVRNPLLFGDQAEIVADVPPAQRGELERHPASVIAASVGVSVSDLPNVRLFDRRHRRRPQLVRLAADLTT